MYRVWDENWYSRSRTTNGVRISTVNSLEIEPNQTDIGQNQLSHSHLVVFLSTSTMYRTTTDGSLTTEFHYPTLSRRAEEF